MRDAGEKVEGKKGWASGTASLATGLLKEA